MTKLLKPGEAAKLLGVTVWTLRLWHNQGKVKAQQTHGGHCRYRLEDIRRISQR